MHTGSSDKTIQEHLVSMSSDFGLTQLQEEPTRQGNILDLAFTTNPSLIKSTSVIPGISDHDAVIIDSLSRPQYLPRAGKRKIFIFAKANWDSLRDRCADIAVNVT